MGFGEANGHIPQQQYPPGHRPQIYTVRLPQDISLGYQGLTLPLLCILTGLGLTLTHLVM